MKKNILRIIFLILVIINAVVIFIFSAQDGKKSEKISQKIVNENLNNVKTTNQTEKDKILKQREKIVRKIAHVLIYTSLGIWSMSFISTFNMKNTRKVLFATIWGAFYASTDELHQRFISGRSGNITDVFIDTIGVLLGIAIVMLIIFISKKITKKLSESKGEKMKAKESGVTLLTLVITIILMAMIASTVILLDRGDSTALELANQKRYEAEVLAIKEDIKNYLAENPPKTYQELINKLTRYGTINNANDASTANLITSKGNYVIYVKDLWNVSPMPVE